MQLLLTGQQERPGWIRVDSEATDLSSVESASARSIDAGALLTELDLATARVALAEWRRCLGAGGDLRIELPCLEAATRVVGSAQPGMADPGLAAIFGTGSSKPHRSAWNRRLLENELRAAGFDQVQVQATEDGRLRATARVLTAPMARAVPHASRSVDGRRRFFAWPAYRDISALQRFFADYAALLANRGDCILVLGFDARRDGDRNSVVAALEQVHARVLGPDTALDITLLDETFERDDWVTVGQHLEGRIALDSDLLWPEPLVMDCQVFATAAALQHHLAPSATPASAAPATQPGELLAPSATTSTPLSPITPASPITPDRPVTSVRPATATAAFDDEDEPVVVDPELLPGLYRRDGGPVDPALAETVSALHPWFYPVELDGHVVEPGLGSPCTTEWLRSNAVHRAQLMVRGILSRIGVRGARVLDLACNCGFWSSFYARAGATEVFGLEGRRRHVEQARLYWRTNGFLPEGKWRFEHGNVSDAADWAQVCSEGPFDLTVVAGILHHVPNHEEVLRWASAVTTGAMIVDTRVQDGHEDLIDEPGEMRFNAIRATRRKVVPDRDKLLACLHELGFQTEVLPVPFGSVLGVEDGDDYAQGRRVTILAHRT